MDDYFEGMNLNFAEAPLLSKINDNSSAFFQSEIDNIADAIDPKSSLFTDIFGGTLERDVGSTEFCSTHSSDSGNYSPNGSSISDTTSLNQSFNFKPEFDCFTYDCDSQLFSHSNDTLSKSEVIESIEVRRNECHLQQHPQQCGDQNFDDLTEIQLSERNEILHTNSPLYADEFGYKIGQPSSLNVMENQQTYYSQIVSDNDNSEEGERTNHFVIVTSPSAANSSVVQPYYTSGILPVKKGVKKVKREIETSISQNPSAKIPRRQRSLPLTTAQSLIYNQQQNNRAPNFSTMLNATDFILPPVPTFTQSSTANSISTSKKPVQSYIYAQSSNERTDRNIFAALTQTHDDRIVLNPSTIISSSPSPTHSQSSPAIPLILTTNTQHSHGQSLSGQQILFSHPQIVVTQTQTHSKSRTKISTECNNNVILLRGRANQRNASAKGEDFIRKLEDRKLKNREAAQLSRIRKRKEFEQLKYELFIASKKCETLRVENHALKERIDVLEQENIMLRNVQPLPALAPKGRRNPNTIIMQSQQQLAKPTPTMAKTVGLCLFVLVAFVAFPNGKYSNNNIELNPNVPSLIHHPIPELERKRENSQTFHKGRLLQPNSIRSNNETFNYELGRVINDYFNQTHSAKHTSTNASTANSETSGGCNQANRFWNSSQSIILTNELSDWVDRHEEIDMIRLLRRPPPLLLSGRFAAAHSATSGDDSTSTRSMLLDLSATTDAEVEGTPTTRKKVDNRRRATELTKKNSISLENKPIKKNANRSKAPNMRRIREHLQNMVSASPNKLRIKDNDSSSSKENFDIIPFNPQFSTGLIADLVARLKQNNDNDVLHLITLKDYFLLPTVSELTDTNSTGTKIHKNRTTVSANDLNSPPKLSIILPALLSVADNSTNTNRIRLLRIECEVVGTSFLLA